VTDEVQVLRLDAASGLNTGKVTSAGDIIALSVKDRRLFRLRSGAAAQSWEITGMPQSYTAIRPPDLLPDLALDPAGRILVPSVWHVPADGKGKRFSSGAFVYSSAGTFSQAIVFNPPVEVRRLAVDAEGSVYAAGLDGAYFRRLTEQCLLVHKYAPDGQRLTAFSACPGEASGSRSTRYKQVKDDADESHLWVAAGQVVHVLPVSRLARIFDLNGKLLREVKLTPPDDTAVLLQPFPLSVPVTERRIFRIFPVGGGNWLVNWLVIAGPYRRAYLTVHNSDGRPLSQATVFPRLSPVAADDGGNIFFVRPATSGPADLELVRARIAVR
jgi:hypothetical protein